MPRNIRRLSALGPLFVVWLLVAGGPDAAWAEGTFYVAPKVMVGKQKTSFGPPAIDIKDIPNDQPLSNPGNRHLKPEYTGVFPGRAFHSEDSVLLGGVALGVDFHERLAVPLRLEFEIAMKGDAKGEGESQYYYPNQAMASGTYHRITTNSLSYTMHTAFINAYADWHNDRRFTPYVGGGLGAALIDLRAVVSCYSPSMELEPSGYYGAGNARTPANYEKRVTNFAWHLDAGLSFNLTEKTAIDLGYRYLDVGKPVKFGDEPRVIYDSTGPNTMNATYLLYGPKEVKFEPTHQLVLGFRYSF
jgi:opacity protein-like surface antigen